MRAFAIMLLTGLGVAPLSAQPRDIEVSEHRAARADFPMRAGDFHRTRVVQYDAEGLDLSASYDLRRPEGRVTATVYIYPVRPLADDTPSSRATACRQEFEASSDQIKRQSRPIDKLGDDAPVEIAGTTPALRHRAAFGFQTAFDGREQPVRSELHLYCFVDDRWLVKFRITGPAGIDAREAIGELIRMGPWPGRSARSIAAVAPPKSAAP